MTPATSTPLSATAESVISRRGLLRGAAALGGLALATPGLGVPAGVAHAAASTGGPLARHHAPDVLLGWLDLVFDQVRLERASPPSAARIYGALAVAGYEGIVAGAPDRRTLGGQLNGLAATAAPTGRGTIDWRAALNAAIARAMAEAFADRSDVAKATLAAHAVAVHDHLVGESGTAAERGAQHGTRAGDTVVSWLRTDGYTASRGLPFEPPVGPGLWVKTPPNFGSSLEPHWWMVRPFALADGGECTPVPPVPFDTTPGSGFHAQATAVHVASLGLTDAKRATALYWRDNPDGVTGLPAGHWMQIAAGQAAKRDLAGAAELLAVVGVVIADSFTSCWVEKYRTNLVRPVTYIQSHIDPSWNSFVNSPAFPEYTSGHSVGSGAAARALTVLVGSVPFTDDAAAQRGEVPRSFSSFDAAAQEAAVSRLYGGIHYPMAIEVGLAQGVQVADVVLGRIRTRR